MVGGSLHRSCSSTYRRVDVPSSVRGPGKSRGKGGPKKGKKSTRAQQEEEHEEEQAQEEEHQEEEQEQAQDEEYVPPSAEEASGGEHKEEEDDTTGVSERGRSRLPNRPIPIAQRPLIKPVGTR
jgi:hypothetical protein